VGLPVGDGANFLVVGGFCTFFGVEFDEFFNGRGLFCYVFVFCLF